MTAGGVWLVATALAAEPAPLRFPSAPDPVCDVRRFELAFVGDTIVHGMQLQAARQPDGTYSFDGVLDGVAPWLTAADLAIANLETTIAGEDLGGYTGFPLFNSPESLLDELVDAGIDAVQLTNNHVLDRGVEGLFRTIEATERHGLLHAGTFRSPEERARPWIFLPLPTGARVAYLAYTFSTNAPQMPTDMPWLLGLTDLGQMDRDIVLARRDADFVIVGMHWGLNYSPEPVDWVEKLGRRLVDAGADMIIGHHPHVLERVDVLAATDDNGRPRDALVVNSLGNFLSNQREPYRWGAVIAHVEISVCEATRRVWTSGVRFTPFWVDDRRLDGELAFRVLPAPPFGETCTDLDLDAVDCSRMLAERDHAAAVLGRQHLSWALWEREPAWVPAFDPWGVAPWPGYAYAAPFRTPDGVISHGQRVAETTEPR